MLAYIYDNYESKVSLSDIAQAGGVCKSKCCQIFKKYLSRSPIEYLNSYRLEKSMHLLRDAHLSITEIAYSCGFSNASYFSEIFTKYKGFSPTEFRRQKEYL